MRFFTFKKNTHNGELLVEIERIESSYLLIVFACLQLVPLHSIDIHIEHVIENETIVMEKEIRLVKPILIRYVIESGRFYPLEYLQVRFKKKTDDYID